MTTQVITPLTYPTIILIHGGWHGAWCWYQIVPMMKERGLKVVAVDLPGHGMDKTPASDVTMDDYVNKIIEAASEVEGEVILLGHSSGGTVIAQASEQLTPGKVSALIFLDAFMPMNGESVFSLVKKFPNNPDGTKGAALAESMIFSKDQKTSTLNLDKVKELLYHDCEEADIELAKSRLGAQPIAPQATPVAVTDENYGSIPKYYILCTNARDFDKTGIAYNVACKKVYRLESSHSPFFSMPGELVQVLEDIHKQSAVSVASSQ